MKRFTKFNQKMLRGGLWDNGLYVYSDEVVEFPEGLFKEKAIVEDFEIFVSIHTGDRFAKKAKRITIDGRSWIVHPEEIPNG